MFEKRAQLGRLSVFVSGWSFPGDRRQLKIELTLRVKR